VRLQDLHCWMNDSALRFLMLIIVVALVRYQLALLLQSYLNFFLWSRGGGVCGLTLNSRFCSVLCMFLGFLLGDKHVVDILI
jgi:hypothetical protein